MLKTDKIYLSPLLEENSRTLFNWINERDLVVFNNNYKPIHESNHKIWFENIIKRQDAFIFGIKQVDTNELIGSCQLNQLNWINRNAELQIRIAVNENRGKGFGSDAVRLLLKFAFDDLNLNKVYLHVLANNVRAAKAYEKTGFQKEGELKQQAFIDGEYIDVISMGILKKDHDEN